MLNISNDVKHKLLGELDRVETVFLNQYAADTTNEQELEEVLKELEEFKNRIKRKILISYHEIMQAWEI